MRGRKVLVIAALAAAVLIAGTAAMGWRSYSLDRQAARDSLQRTTTMQLTGTPGGQFTGHYVVNGKRVAVSGVLPSTFAEAGVWQFEFRKADPNNTLIVEARDGRSYVHFTAAAGTRGVRANTKTGWNVGPVTD